MNPEKEFKEAVLTFYDTATRLSNSAITSSLETPAASALKLSNTR